MKKMLITLPDILQQIKSMWKKTFLVAISITNKNPKGFTISCQYRLLGCIIKRKGVVVQDGDLTLEELKKSKVKKHQYYNYSLNHDIKIKVGRKIDRKNLSIIHSTKNNTITVMEGT